MYRNIKNKLTSCFALIVCILSTLCVVPRFVCVLINCQMDRMNCQMDPDGQ